MFHPVHGGSWYLSIVLLIGGCVVAFAGMQLVPKHARKFVILGITFIAGAYYALEFFLPVHKLADGSDGNFLSPYMESVSNWLAVIGAFTVGLGVVNLSLVHGKRLSKGGNTAFNSAVFFVSMIVMMVVGILQKIHPNTINKSLFELLFAGALTTLDATMFSIIAFYIVSAAYRAFRVKSTEATILLITAVVVMMGQIAVGQWLTTFNHSQGLVGRNLHFEVVRDWILTQANTAAVRAISFGLGIGALAVALRIWLGLERGSYFDSQRLSRQSEFSERSIRVNLLRTLQTVDRRVLYALLLLSVTIPFFLPFKVPVKISPATQKLYDTIESLPENSFIIFGSDWSAGTRGENGAQTEALMRHVMRHKLRFAILCFDPQAATLTQSIAERMESEYGYKEGVNWTNWGFRVQEVLFFKALAKDVVSTVRADIHGTPIQSLPVMAGVTTASDFKLLLNVNPTNSYTYYIQFLQGPFHIPMVFAPTAVMAPEAFNYVDSGQISGMLNGLSGAIEYEQLLGVVGRARQRTAIASRLLTY